MDDFIMMSEFLDLVSETYDTEAVENSTLDEVGVDVDEFIDFLEEKFDFSEVQIRSMRNSLHSDMILHEIYNAYFG